MTTVSEVREFILDSEDYPTLRDIYDEFGNSMSTTMAIHLLQVRQEIIFCPDEEDEVILYVKPSPKMQKMIDKGAFIRW